jgi:hypothetical protein
MKTYGGSGGIDPRLLGLVEGEWSASRSCRFTFPEGKNPGTFWLGGLVDLGAGLDNMEKSKFLKLLCLTYDIKMVK